MNDESDAIRFLLSVLIVNHERMRIISKINNHFENDSGWLDSRYNLRRAKWILSLIKGRLYSERAHCIVKEITSGRYSTQCITDLVLLHTNRVSEYDPVGSVGIELFADIWKALAD